MSYMLGEVGSAQAKIFFEIFFDIEILLGLGLDDFRAYSRLFA